MKRRILTITIMLITSTVVNAQHNLPWTMGGRQQAQVQRWRIMGNRYTPISRTGSYYGQRNLPWTMGGRRQAQIQRWGTMGNRYYPGSYYGQYNRYRRGSRTDRIAVGGNIALNVLGMVIDAKQNQQALEMAKKEQQVQLEIARAQRKEAERQESSQIAASLKQQQNQGDVKAENEKLRQENEALRLELEKAHLEAELEKSKAKNTK
jgi:hypothetical protein